ncbi:TPA: hypothetical protein ACS72N_002484 [Providencia alcalifaciens]
MSENTQPNIQQTIIEDVLIKHHALNSNRYAQSVIKHAQHKAKDHIQHAQQSEETLYTTAYQHGYQDGLQQLLQDFIAVLEASEKQYQYTVSKTEERLTKVLTHLFADLRLQEIIAEYFIQLQPETAKTQLHLPTELQTTLGKKINGIKTLNSQNNHISLEVGNKITHFSPDVAAKNIQPQILSISARCQIQQQHKEAYSRLIQQLSISRKHNEN